jgi:hypothetical protein
MYLPAGMGFQAVLTTEDASAGPQGPQAVLCEVHAEALVSPAVHSPSPELLTTFRGALDLWRMSYRANLSGHRRRAQFSVRSR